VQGNVCVQTEQETARTRHSRGTLKDQPPKDSEWTDIYTGNAIQMNMVFPGTCLCAKQCSCPAY